MSHPRNSFFLVKSVKIPDLHILLTLSSQPKTTPERETERLPTGGQDRSVLERRHVLTTEREEYSYGTYLKLPFFRLDIVGGGFIELR